MNLQKLITNYADYNLWANQQLVTWLAQKPVEQLNQEVASSFPSILKTLNHIWAIEEFWYATVIKSLSFEDRYSAQVMVAGEIFEGLINRSTLVANGMKLFTEAELTEKIKVENPWLQADLPRYEYLQQLVNHGTYHRGQLTTIARNAGLTDVPNTDYVFFAVANG